MAENTFLGLQPYTEDDAYRFKGRTEESQELFRLIVRNDFTVCYAESGEGKTSLLNAGVFPLLRENMYFPIAITFTSDDYQVTPDNFSTIIDRCIKDSITEYNEKNKGISVEYRLCSTDFQGLDCQAELQQELSKYSWWKLRNYKPQAMGLTFTPVFVFDQFEEVFNMPGSIVWTKKFFDWLEDVSSDSCPDKIAKKIRAIIGTNAAFPAIKEEKDFKAVFSLRKEFIGELDYWGMQKCFIPSLKDNRYCLKTLTYEGAKKVMTQQQHFEEAKVEQVLHYFVQQYSREPEKTIAENLPVIPALLLSVVCDSWEKDIDFFSGKDENEIGQSLNRILERFYTDALSSITKELSQLEGNSLAETIRENIETAIFALVDSNGKRVRRKSSELSHLDFDTKYKEILSNNRIIKNSKIDGEDYVEIVHDALCPIIVKRKELYLAAEANKREEERLREQAKKNRKRLLLLSCIIIIAFIIIGFFFHQNRKIQKSQWQMMENQARFVAEKASSLVDEGDSYLARLLCINILPDNDEDKSIPYEIEAEMALRKAMQDENAVLRGHTSAVWYVSLSPDGKRLASASSDQTIRIWDVETGKNVLILNGHKDRVNTASFDSDGHYLVSASSDHSIRIWNSFSGEEIKVLNGHKDRVNSALFSSDGKLIISASYDKTVRLWDSSGRELKIFSGHTDAVNYASFSPNNLFVASAAKDNTIRLWNVETGDCIRILEGHTGLIDYVAFSPDGQRIISSSNDKTIRIWDFNTGKVIHVLSGHSELVKSATFSPDGKYIISASDDRTIRIWNAETGLLVFSKAHYASVKFAVFSPDMRHFYYASIRKDICKCDLNIIENDNILYRESDALLSVVFSPDGKMIAFSNSKGVVQIWDCSKRELSYKWVAHNSMVHSVRFSPDGRLIASSSGTGEIIIWNSLTEIEFQKFVGHRSRVNSIVFSPDGKLLASASYDQTIRIWDVKSGDCLKTLYGHKNGVYSVSFRNDGQQLVSSSGDGTIRIWDLESGVNKKTFHCNSAPNNYAIFSLDGKYIISASSDQTICKWDIATGQNQILDAHIGCVWSVAMSLNGNLFVSASDDNTVRVWDLDRCINVQTFKGHTSSVYYATFSPDGQHIASISEDGTLRIWNYPPLQQLIGETRDRFKSRQLTPEERRQYYLE